MIDEGRSKARAGRVFGLHLPGSCRPACRYAAGPTMASPTASRHRPGRQRMAPRRIRPSIRSSPPRISSPPANVVSRTDRLARAGGHHRRPIQGGVHENVIPDAVEMRGTVRTFDEAMRDDAARAGEDAAERSRAPRAPAATSASTQALSGHRQRPGAHRGDACRPSERVAGPRGRLMLVPKVTGSEDFSFFQRRPRVSSSSSASRPGRTTRRRRAQPLAALLHR